MKFFWLLMLIPVFCSAQEKIPPSLENKKQIIQPYFETVYLFPENVMEDPQVYAGLSRKTLDRLYISPALFPPSGGSERGYFFYVDVKGHREKITEIENTSGSNWISGVTAQDGLDRMTELPPGTGHLVSAAFLSSAGQTGFSYGGTFQYNRGTLESGDTGSSAGSLPVIRAAVQLPVEWPEPAFRSYAARLFSGCSFGANWKAGITVSGVLQTSETDLNKMENRNYPNNGRIYNDTEGSRGFDYRQGDVQAGLIWYPAAGLSSGVSAGYLYGKNSQSSQLGADFFSHTLYSQEGGFVEQTSFSEDHQRWERTGGGFLGGFHINATLPGQKNLLGFIKYAHPVIKTTASSAVYDSALSSEELIFGTLISRQAEQSRNTQVRNGRGEEEWHSWEGGVYFNWQVSPNVRLAMGGYFRDKHYSFHTAEEMFYENHLVSSRSGLDTTFSDQYLLQENELEFRDRKDESIWHFPLQINYGLSDGWQLTLGVDRWFSEFRFRERQSLLQRKRLEIVNGQTSSDTNLYQENVSPQKIHTADGTELYAGFGADLSNSAHFFVKVRPRLKDLLHVEAWAAGLRMEF
ncbi:MAG: hypothetical protein WAN36_08095 [Calditrichia bacterium]